VPTMSVKTGSGSGPYFVIDPSARQSRGVTGAGFAASASQAAFAANDRFLAVSSGFGDQVSVVPAWRVDEGGDVSLAA
jgi:hypothetical protein